MQAAMFAKAASDRNGTYAIYRGEPSESLYANLGEQIESSGCPKVLLSSECFMEWVEPATIKRLLDLYCQCEIKVILVLRRQDQWIQSVFNQVVKDPGLRYAGALEELPQIGMLDYLTTVKRWAEAFGPDALVIKTYAETAKYRTGVLGCLAEVIGLPLTEDLDFPSFHERNVSLRRWQMDVLQELNRRDTSLNTFQSALEAFLKMNEESHSIAGDTVNCIDYRKARSLYRQYKRDNNKLSATFMGRSHLFNPPTRKEYPKPTLINSVTIADFLTRLKTD